MQVTMAMFRGVANTTWLQERTKEDKHEEQRKKNFDLYRGIRYGIDHGIWCRFTTS